MTINYLIRCSHCIQTVHTRIQGACRVTKPHIDTSSRARSLHGLHSNTHHHTTQVSQSVITLDNEIPSINYIELKTNPVLYLQTNVRSSAQDTLRSNSRKLNRRYIHLFMQQEF
jgi:hypothetical protein